MQLGVESIISDLERAILLKKEVAALSTARSQLKFEIKLRVSEVQWSSVQLSLEKRFKLNSAAARKLIREFIGRFNAALDPFWFRNQELSKEFNQLLIAVCEVHGADSVVFEGSGGIGRGLLRFDYSQSIKFTPGLVAEQSGRCEPKIQAALFGKGTEIGSAVQAAAWRLLIFSLLICLYVIGVGGLFYSIAVFISFLDNPSDGLIAATKDGLIGLALLCFLVGFAGLAGRVFRGIYSSLRSR